MRLGHSTMWSGGGPIGSSEVSRVPKLPIAAPLSIGGVTWKLPQPLDFSSLVALNQAPRRRSDESRLLLLFCVLLELSIFCPYLLFLCLIIPTSCIREKGENPKMTPGSTLEFQTVGA